MVRDGDRVLELGAGVGLVSTIAAKKTDPKNVICVEANPGLLPLIAETHRINGVSDVTVLGGVAVAQDDGGEVSFYLREHFWASSMTPGPDAREVKVPRVGIADLIARHAPQVLSMDIEGAEAALMAGVDLGPCRTVMMELHPRVYGQVGTASIFRKMHEQGFTYDARRSRGGTVVVFSRYRDMPATKVCAITCMKNEAPFILEWVAYHRAIGVTDFLVFTNDCNDGTIEILDRLDDLGIVRHMPNISKTIKSDRHQPYALAYAMGHRQVREADWIISMDVDEFINVHAGDGSLDALFAACSDAELISLSHLDFGCGGQEKYEPVFVTKAFTRSASKGTEPPERRGVKTLISRNAPPYRISNHRPHMAEKIDGTPIWVNGSGRRLGNRFKHGEAKGFAAKRCYRFAQLNHYPVRSMESYLAKSEKGNVVAINAFVGENYWTKRDRNEAEDLSIQKRLPAAEKQYEAFLADPMLADLHVKAVAYHVERIKQLRADEQKAALLDQIRADTERRMRAAEVAAE